MPQVWIYPPVTIPSSDTSKVSDFVVNQDLIHVVEFDSCSKENKKGEGEAVTLESAVGNDTDENAKDSNVDTKKNEKTGDNDKGKINSNNGTKKPKNKEEKWLR